jgi:hypothetical protein
LLRDDAPPAQELVPVLGMRSNPIGIASINAGR